MIPSTGLPLRDPSSSGSTRGELSALGKSSPQSSSSSPESWPDTLFLREPRPSPSTSSNDLCILRFIHSMLSRMGFFWGWALVVRLDWMNLAGKGENKLGKEDGERVWKGNGSVLERIDDSFIMEFHFQEIRISQKMGKRAIEQRQVKPQIGSKPKRRRVESFSIYIYKILKQVHTGLTMSKKAIGIINSFVYDTFDRIATEAAKLVKLNRAKTLKIRDVRYAVKLILPGEVGRHAVSEGNRTTMFKYKQQFQ